MFPGSWINGDFYIWIGHPDDHRAWGQLVDARRALNDVPSDLPAAAVDRAREELLIAEGSDWFWWYGDDHSSDHDLEFDELFRRHVRNVYRALEKPIPAELFVTNITTAAPAAPIQRPTGFVHPVIDGEVTDYFEWVGAGCIEGSSVAGAMHQVAERAPGIAVVEFGFDEKNLFVRVDGSTAMREMLARGGVVFLRFLKPAGLRVSLSRGQGQLETTVERMSGNNAWVPVQESGVLAAVGQVAELAVPFAELGVRTGDRVALFVLVTNAGVEIDRQPRHQAIEIEVPDQRFAIQTWTA